jgi:MFS family permease
LPDRVGGARVSLVCILIEAAGLAFIWYAPSPNMAILGSFVIGMGYSLVYPGFGVEVVRLTPLESRGLAMGTYTAFLDLSLGIANPALGIVADHAGLGPVFLTSIVIVLLSTGIAVRLLQISVPT